MIHVVDTATNARTAYFSTFAARDAAYKAVRDGRSDRLEIRNCLYEIIGECRSIDRAGERAVVVEGTAWAPDLGNPSRVEPWEVSP